MKLRTLTIILVCIFMPTLLLAQSLTNKQRRIINSKVLSIIEEYEQYATLYDDEAAYYFGELFTDDATIVSDMIGAPSYLRGISSDDYINLLLDIYGKCYPNSPSNARGYEKFFLRTIV